MTGREYVSEAAERAERVISEIKSSGLLGGDPLVEGAIKACADLGQLKNRATLRTRTGTNLAFPVLDAAQNLEEMWGSARQGDGLEDLKTCMDDFISAVEVLGGALKERTVIMT